MGWAWPPLQIDLHGSFQGECEACFQRTLIRVKAYTKGAQLLFRTFWRLSFEGPCGSDLVFGVSGFGVSSEPMGLLQPKPSTEKLKHSSLGL